MADSTVRLADDAAKVWPDIPARSVSKTQSVDQKVTGSPREMWRKGVVLVHGADEFAALRIDLRDVIVAGFDPNRSAGGVEQRRPCRKQRDCQRESVQPSEGMVLSG